MITLKLPSPPSVNKYYIHTRRGVRISDEGQIFKQMVSVICHNMQVEPLEGEVRLTVRFFFKNKRRDIDNGLKALQDALNELAWKDDVQVKELHVFKYASKEEYCEVDIEQIASKQKALL